MISAPQLLMLDLHAIIPLLMGDERLGREWIEMSRADYGRCESLIRGASLLGKARQPSRDAYIPFQEISVLGRLLD